MLFHLNGPVVCYQTCHVTRNSFDIGTFKTGIFNVEIMYKYISKNSFNLLITNMECQVSIEMKANMLLDYQMQKQTNQYHLG